MAKSSKKVDAHPAASTGASRRQTLLEKCQFMAGAYEEMQARYRAQIGQLYDEVGAMRLSAAIELHVREGNLPVKIAELRRSLGLSPEPTKPERTR